MRQRFYLALLALLLAVGAFAAPSGSASAAGGPVTGSYSRVANAASLRIRSGPGRSYGTVATARKGEIVKVLSGPHNAEWYEVSYRGNKGYSLGANLRHTGLRGQELAAGASKVIVVSLARQQLEAYENGELYMVSAVTTGRPELRTPTGTFQAMAKKSPKRFVSPWPKGSPYYYKPVTSQYAIKFRTNGFFFHDAPWRPYMGYGTSVPHTDPDGVRRTGSHGCVNVPLWAMGKLYGWTTIGTTVKIIGG